MPSRSEAPPRHHAFLWWIGDDARLSEPAREAIADPGNDVSFSVASLPAHHRDPFDRLLVAQAAAEGLTLVSRDPQQAKYGTPILW